MYSGACPVSYAKASATACRFAIPTRCTMHGKPH